MLKGDALPLSISLNCESLMRFYCGGQQMEEASEVDFREYQHPSEASRHRLLMNILRVLEA